MQSVSLEDAIWALRRSPEAFLGCVDASGRQVVAYLVKPEAMPVDIRPMDPPKPHELPRHLRPKQRLSKRQRDMAKRERLHGAPVG